MARVSFGSRAGNATFGGSHRQALIHGPYNSLDELTNALQQEFETARLHTQSASTALELSLSLDAVVPLVRPGIGPYADGGDHDLPDEFKNGLYETQGEPDQKHPRAPCSAIINVMDPEAKKIVQRAASRGIMAAIEALDGFRYSFNNAWNAQNDEGARFSFICQDSMQNKDRHANGYTRVLKHLKDPTGNERGPRKPTYDCKGSVSVKFSTSKQSCEVFYRHNAIHETVAARKAAPRTPGRPPRVPGDWTRAPNSAPPYAPRGEQDDGGLSAMLQAETASSALAMVDSSPTVSRPAPTTSNMGRPLKRKREEFARPRPASYAADQSLSLADLLRRSETARVAPAPPGNSYNNFLQGAAAVAYELPSWQKPPPSINRPPGGQPFPLPYQPQTKSTPAQPQTPIQPSNSRPPMAGGSQHSGPGLYTVMKVKNTPKSRSLQQSYQAPMNEQLQSKPQAVLACTSCRIAKRRCDEARPMCGLCVKLNKTECHYEGPTTHVPNATGASQQQGVGNGPAHQRPAGLALPSLQPAQGPGQSSGGKQTETDVTQGASQHVQSAQPSQQAPVPIAPMQQQSQPSWDNEVSPQHTPLASWSQDPSLQQWPSQGSPPLQAWGNITMAQQPSPDPWYPKR
ncbi:hypothetical protein CB0940_08923 [Cercospora beticola]|uniref:Zn(2)-C6 fungal-type domain-containing protein n=1 Tax=Cercospora beticola TaxID=122368 RepID=A0A2G5HPJ9_CERBT|nr:hypothetical protein CB0940_08923 [Cercospora beticola]PIA94459.1 hypothetical protein CB0940_08923 [Cercospora beticola]WPB05518.1 hypothetical protein RHO25_010171 [Cercospora beticola]CAK1365338.1 unnamed protein product [Cercospora beticola]